MTNNTLENSYVGRYKFSPLAAHTLDQWFDNETTQVVWDMSDEQQEQFDADKQKRADFRKHLMGNLKMNNLERERAVEEVQPEGGG